MKSDTIRSLNIKTEKLVFGWNNTFRQIVSEYIQEQANVLDGIRKNIEVLKNKSGNIADANLYEFHANNLLLLKSLYTSQKSKSETKDFIELVKNGLLKDIDTLEATVTDVYNTRLDYPLKGIGSNRLLRKTGNFFYYFRNIPNYILIGFAKIFKTPFKPLKQRHHTIHYRKIIKGFLLDEYILSARNRLFEIQKKLAKLSFELFELEGNIIKNNYQFENFTLESFTYKDINEELSKIDNFYETYKAGFITLLEKSGTWEFPAFYIHLRKEWNLKIICSQIEAAHKTWHSTFYALYEDWRFREELFAFISTINKQQSEVLNSNYTKLDKTLIPVITSKREYLEQLTERVPDSENTDHSSLKYFFTSELYKLQKEVRKQSIVEDLNKIGSEIEKILRKIEVDVNEALEKIPNKSGVVRSPDYEKGIRKSDIYSFSPKEFINYNCIPPFFSNVQATSEDFRESFSRIIIEFSDFDQIIDFSLDTAISMLNAHSSLEDTILMFKEGMKRSLNILDRITEHSEELVHTKEKKLANFYLDFISTVKALDNNETILGIYSSLLKSKTIQKYKNKRRKFFSFLSLSVTSLGSFFKKQFKILDSYYISVRKKLKLDKAPVFVSSEISNYLAEINKRVFKLPVIYRYLFENAPVKEINLFLSRQPEFEKIDSAINDWKLGNYAATLIIGENGGGKTSLLQHYIKTIKGGFKIYYHSVNRFYHTQNDFYELMQDILDNKELKSEQNVIEQFDLVKGQKIIVLDGIERIFIRKPGGFECLHKLLSFIVSTNRQVLWICSVSLHACNYLNKTISLKENFDYLVELNTLTPEEVQKIILKRHRLSGFIMQYEDNLKQPDKNKKIKDRQSLLEKEFFRELNRFAGSNISLSLYYWLESISEFTDKELYIKRFVNPDFSFLETLSAEKIYTLLLIVLHGKISVDIHASICNQRAEKSLKILTILKEDSLLALKGEYYMLNGILYRQVVQLFKSRNLIH